MKYSFIKNDNSCYGFNGILKNRKYVQRERKNIIKEPFRSETCLYTRRDSKKKILIKKLFEFISLEI